MNMYEALEPVDSWIDLLGAQIEFLAGQNRSGVVIILRVTKAVGEWEDPHSG